LEGFPAPFSGVLPDLSFARDGAHEIDPPASSLASNSIWWSRRDARSREQDVPKSAARFALDDADDEADQVREATRITLRPHDPSTGEEVEKEDVVKGYEYRRGQFVTLSAEELKALDVESSKVIDLEKFVPRGEIDPVYFDAPY
jgi:Ku70/Ku80 beta-barrel domain